jgi:capsid assembly protease
MRYARILSAVAGTVWAIHPAKGQAIIQFLQFAAAGGKRSPEEVAAIIGRPPRAYDDGDEDRGARAAAQEAQAISDRGGVAVISLSGVISPRLSEEMYVSGGGVTSAEGFIGRIQAAVDDPRVGGIIIDCDSPGGNVYGVSEACAALMAARAVKPIVAVANPVTASAAYWMCCAASEVVVTPSGEVGSIGVYTYHEDLSKALADAGINMTIIKAGVSPKKSEQSSAFPLTDEAKAAMQAGVDRYGNQFVADIARARGKPVADVVASFGGGRMLGAKDAVACGMADRIGTLDQEIARMAASLAKPAGSSASIEQRRRRAAMW